jgi:predicted glycosyltransferase
MHQFRLYYAVKPALPLSLRIALRRRLARSKRDLYRRLWPIQESAGKAPENWRGWPEGKKFAFVLTHDVEGARGLDQCRRLMEIEFARGFRSSFGFVPEGEYSVSPELLGHLREKGFEIAVHDLHHDGKLYTSEQDFEKKATRINGYLQKWQAVGFRSGLMHHNLKWLKRLNVAYDCSTFDFDPFEPQPDGVETIFPFRIEREDGSSFVELPYTLIQDFNLFVVLQERSIDLWKKKLDWIAEKGGMALLDTHPDFMCFNGNKIPYNQYPISFYEEFLDYAKSRYGNEYWHATPHQVAQHINGGQSADSPIINERPPAAYIRRADTKKIWIDLDNTPHVPFFEPIIAELKKQGHSVLITARDAFQVIDLADQKKMEFISIGHHYGKNKAAKVWGLVCRAMQLAPVVIPYKPDLAISHGARSQLFLCNLLGIKSILLADYEFGKLVPTTKPSLLIVPEAMSHAEDRYQSLKIRRYPGIKENVYVPYFKPDASLSNELGLRDEDIVVTVRPPATEAHYHNPASEVLFHCLMETLIHEASVRVVLLPRNKHQHTELLGLKPEWFSDGKIIVPSRAVDGLNLIWNSDLVVSGGGTMNREAAALNVPVYSIFRGPIGDIDRYLEADGRLTMIETPEDISGKIQIRKRPRIIPSTESSNATLESILGHIDRMLQ